MAKDVRAKDVRAKGESAPETAQEPAVAAPPDPTSVADDPEMMNAFLVEAREHLETVETRMLALERNPKDLDSIHAIFRAFHTIKGLAGFFDLNGVRALTHEIETLLNEARNSRLEIRPEVADVILESADRLNVSLRALDRGLRDLSAPELAVDESLVARIHQILQSPDDVAGSRPAPVPAAATGQEEATSQLAAEALTIKVATAKLDYLVEMIGETITAEALVHADPALDLLANRRLAGNLSRLGALIGEVQQAAMSMRMVPIRHLFQRLARLSRDLSRKAGKSVQFDIQGEDTELDRNIVEGLHDPLMHMIRNSIDHGIEDGETRVAHGKNAVGTIELKAAHESSYIVIQIADDGRGMDPEKFRRRAVEAGFIADSAELSAEESLNLIFMAGFSTAAQVTDISGRGVGMDVVRRHVQKLRGRIEIESVVGQGTIFTIKLPLTLAIVTGLVVMVGANRYVLPMFSVREVLRGQDTAVHAVEGHEEVAMIRGRVHPFVRLHKRFDVPGACEDPANALMIVTDSDIGTYCLMVDRLVGQQEVVIKSLGQGMEDVPGLSGGAILGDGTIGLILDAARIPEWSLSA